MEAMHMYLVWVFFWCCFIIIQCTRNISYIDRVCPYYEDVLPNGECLEFLKGKRIAQERITLQNLNPGLRILYKAGIPFIELWLHNGETSVEFLSTWLKDCMKINSVKQLIYSMKIPQLSNLRNCMIRTKEAFCINRHPVCIAKQYTDQHGVQRYEITASNVCKVSCFEAFKYCNDTINFLKAAVFIRNVCPRINGLEKGSMDIPNCPSMIKADVKYFEKCQRLSFQQENERNVSTESSCYNDDGRYYRGTINVTRSKKRCVNWSEIGLENIQNYYPLLESNFCRNPQSFAKRPWCFVNMTRREWEECDVPVCNSYSPSISEKFIARYWKETFVSVIVFIIIISLLLVVLQWKRQNHSTCFFIPLMKAKKQRTQPYKTVAINHETMSNTMRDVTV